MLLFPSIEHFHCHSVLVKNIKIRTPALQVGWLVATFGVRQAAFLLTPHPSLLSLLTYFSLTSHFSLLASRFSLLTSHFSRLTSHSLRHPLLTSHSSLLTPHSSSLLTPFLTPHSSLLTPHSSLLLPLLLHFTSRRTPSLRFRFLFSIFFQSFFVFRFFAACIAGRTATNNKTVVWNCSPWWKKER